MFKADAKAMNKEQLMASGSDARVTGLHSFRSFGCWLGFLGERIDGMLGRGAETAGNHASSLGCNVSTWLRLTNKPFQFSFSYK